MISAIVFSNLGLGADDGHPRVRQELIPLKGSVPSGLGAPTLTGRAALETNMPFLHTSGGTVEFTLDAGRTNAGREYFLLGGASGTMPGLTLPGGMAVLPVNWDILSEIILTLMNTSLFQDFHGWLDGGGLATAKLNAPALDPALAGTILYFAYCLNKPYDFASNSAQITINPPGMGFNVHDVADSSAFGTGVALDLQGRPHVVYYSPNLFTKYLNHSYWDGAAWQHEVVAAAPIYANSGPQVEVDDSGRLHVAFFNDQYQLGYALHDGTWHVEVADPTTKSGEYCDLALDSQGRPCIAYATNVPWRTRYAVKNGSSWKIQEVPGAGGYGVDFELDSQDRPHICDASSTIRYSYHDGTQWISETVTNDSSSQYNTMTLDPQDRPQVAFYRTMGSNYDLVHATKDSGVWQTHVVSQGVQQSKQGWDPHIACDASGVLHIAYFAHNQLEIKHAWGKGTNWQNEVVDHVGMYDSSIDFRCEGDDLFISYYDEDLEQVRLAATKSPP